MRSEYAQMFYEKLIKKVNLYSKFSKVKDYSKKPVLDYDEFIYKLEEAKKIYPKHEGFYELMQVLTNECKSVCQSEEMKAKYKPEVLNFACYKMLENEVKNSIVLDGPFDGLNIGIVTDAYEGLNSTYVMFIESLIEPKKKKELEMQK